MRFDGNSMDTNVKRKEKCEMGENDGDGDILSGCEK